MESYSRSKVSGSLPVAAPLVMPTETEVRSRRLAEEFYQKVADKSLDEKYYGHNISETPLVGLLKRLEEHLEVFRHYVIEHSDVNQYQSYGQAAAKSLIGMVNKLTDTQLRAMVFQQIMDMDITREIAVQMIVNKLSETEQKAIKKRFIILKTFADEIFEQATKLVDGAPPAEMISDDNEEPVTLVSKGHGYYDYPDRFFSFDINNFKFSGNPEDDIQTQFRYRQIVLETKFLHAFKAADDKNLQFF
jgi:hypothetical protein